MTLRGIDTNLLRDVVSVYDQNKTTLFGDMKLRTVDAESCIAPDFNKYIDAVADTTLIPLMPEASGDYIFSIQGTATPYSVLCYYAPKGMDTKTFIGRVNLPTGSGTSVLRAFKPYVSGANVTIAFLTTNATAANSGLYTTTNLLLSDFTPGGTTLVLAGIGETSALKRVFKHEESAVNGGAGTHSLTAGNELFLDPANGYVYAKNGSAATWQMYRFKYDVLLTSTSAIGQTTDGFTGANGFKTGNITALAGTVLQNNSGRLTVPTAASGAIVANQGVDNIFFATTTTIYYGKVSELAASITTWPSLTPVNIAGGAGDQVSPAAITFFAFSSVLQRACIFANGRFYFKRLVNNEYDFILGCTDSQQLETNPTKRAVLGVVALTGMEIGDGVLWITSNTVGQRGLLGVNVHSLARFDYSYFITPVVAIQKDIPVALQVRNLLRGFSSGSQIWYRTSGFGSAAGGWVQLPDNYDVSSLALINAAQIQFKVYAYLEKNGGAVAPAVNALRLITQPTASSDREWIGSNKHTSEANASPFFVVWRLQYAYIGGMPAELLVDVLDDSENVIQTLSTIADAAKFTYSTNDGVAWNALGVIPNTPLTTLLRAQIDNPAAGALRPRIRRAD